MSSCLHCADVLSHVKLHSLHLYAEAVEFGTRILDLNRIWKFLDACVICNKVCERSTFNIIIMQYKILMHILLKRTKLRVSLTVLFVPYSYIILKEFTIYCVRKLLLNNMYLFKIMVSFLMQDFSQIIFRTRDESLCYLSFHNRKFCLRSSRS
jgi:hypothetical protein